jgi:deazaflavin-dependent oxidoreductase (nitroreductase family)
MSAERPLRHVDPLAPHGPLHRTFLRLASSGAATRLARTAIWSAVVWRIDPILLRFTRGRLGTGLTLPTALLQTRGARTGRVRRNAVIYFHDGDRVTIVASKAGHPGNPSWFYNACANPDVLLGGQPYRATCVEDEAARSRLWDLADRVFPAFATYRRNAALTDRSIPILQLTPREPPGTAH